MKRRDFLAASCAAGLGAVTAGAMAQDAQPRQRGARGQTGTRPQGQAAARPQGQARDIYELKQYKCASAEQARGVDAFLEKAMIPALNRLGIEQVGVFHERQAVAEPTIYVLLRHRSARTVTTTTASLLQDETYLADGAAFLDAGNENRPYQRIESSLLLAFEGMRQLEAPSKKDTRVFQLRIYESPTVKTGQKKIEMFNVGEIDIFRKTGLNPVFFGEAITGTKIPNLTYMLGFDDAAAQDKAWQTFVKHPEWLALRAKPEYADKKILCGITNILLKPASYSQI
ncbi:MAG: NIPSNAP family protein [Phycisphaerae bacterium]|nr:NIPSNAP family protein [Phycisphaerae bacterium]